jgi:hypothetical protein
LKKRLVTTTLLSHELRTHIPYGIITVANTLVIGSLLAAVVGEKSLATRSDQLFHALHFAHILAASTAVVLSFKKFSKSFFGALALGIIVPAVFCTLSDVLLPYWAGSFFSIDAHLHLCFKDHLSSILPFLGGGVVCGLLIDTESKDSAFLTVTSHLAHSFLSALASLFYLTAHSSMNLWTHMGPLFMLLIISVVIPCTISDVIVPIIFASKLGSSKNLRDHLCH